MRKNWVCRLFSLFVAAALLIQMFPVSAIAAENSSISLSEDDWVTDLEVNDGSIVSETSSSITIIGEDESLRSETGKHFLLSDGSKIAVSYGIPVHYQDEDGAWQDIVNTPVAEESAHGINTYSSINAVQEKTFSVSLNDGHIFESS